MMSLHPSRRPFVLFLTIPAELLLRGTWGVCKARHIYSFKISWLESNQMSSHANESLMLSLLWWGSSSAASRSCTHSTASNRKCLSRFELHTACATGTKRLCLCPSIIPQKIISTWQAEFSVCIHHDGMVTDLTKKYLCTKSLSLFRLNQDKSCAIQMLPLALIKVWSIFNWKHLNQNQISCPHLHWIINSHCW